MQNKYSCGNDPQPGDKRNVFEELIQTIEGTAVNNTATISNVKLWAKSWREELAGEQPQPDMAKLIEEKEREIERLKEQVNDLKMDAAAHEYNEAERIKFQPEYEREICVRFAEYIGGLEMKMYKDGWCEPGGSNGFYYSTNDLYTKFLGEHTANH